MSERKIEWGSMDVIVLDKLFGPTTGVDLRITANTETVMYEIERKTGKNQEWIFWVSIPMQLDCDFEV